MLLAAPLPTTLVAQSQRGTLHIKWTADSSWEGTYFQKPHRFHVHEELEGRLVFDVGDTAHVRVIQLREDGTGTGAQLVEAVGSSAYTSDVTKEGGNCAAERSLDAPYVGREEATAAWDARAPGPAVIVFRGAELVALAFSPKSMRVESSHQLLCEKPEAVKRWQSYRITARFGELVERGAEGQWTSERGQRRATDAAYTRTSRYRSVVTQDRPASADSSGATGRLEVTKAITLTWEVTGPAK